MRRESIEFEKIEVNEWVLILVLVEYAPRG